MSNAVSRRAFLGASLAAGGAMLLDTGPTWADTAGPALRRGVGLHGPLTWPRANADKSGYLFPPFEGPDFEVPQDLLAATAAAGFDFVRLSIDPGPFLSFTGSQRDSLDRLLLSWVDRLRGAGLDVLLDFHPISLVKAFAPQKFIGGTDTEMFQRYRDMVRRTAGLVARVQPGHVALEPMNEPQLGWDSGTRRAWGEMARSLHDAVRSEAPDLMVIMTGGRGGGITGLVEFDPAPYKGSNVLYSFHYYQPYEFTFQGQQSGLWGYITGIPYPASPDQEAAFLEEVAKRVNGDARLGTEQKDKMLAEAMKTLPDYFHGAATKDRIAKDFDRVVDWAKANGIDQSRIFLGEFGVNRPEFRGPAMDQRAAWLRDVRELAEARQFRWSIWALQWNETGIVENKTSNRLQGPILDALGLKGRS